MDIQSFLMDGQYSEEANTALIEKNKNDVEDDSKKSSNPRFFKHLLECLNTGKHQHMLYYVPGCDNKVFEIVFRDEKGKKNWTPKDNSLFEDSDKFLEETYNRKHTSNSKGSFRAKMQKCLNKYVELISDEKDVEDKCKRVARYKILKIPNNSDVEETVSSGRRGSKRKPANIEIKSPKKRRKMDNAKKGKPPEEDVCQEDNNKVVPYDATKEKDKLDSHYLCLPRNSQIILIGPHQSVDLNGQNVMVSLVLPGHAAANKNIIINGTVIPSTVFNGLHITITNALPTQADAYGAVVPSTVFNGLHTAMVTNAFPRQADAYEIDLPKSENQSKSNTMDDPADDDLPKSENQSKSNTIDDPADDNEIYHDLLGGLDITKENDWLMGLDDKYLEWMESPLKSDPSSASERSPSTSDDLGVFDAWLLNYQALDGE